MKNIKPDDFFYNENIDDFNANPNVEEFKKLSQKELAVKLIDAANVISETSRNSAANTIFIANAKIAELLNNLDKLDNND